MTLVVAIGGVRSGKSAWAEHQADELSGGTPVTVLATADPADPSMAERISRHQARRDGAWSVVDLHGRADLASVLPERGVALLDGLGGWVASFLDGAGVFSEDDGAARAAKPAAMRQAHDALQALIDAASAPGRSLVVVTEETGLGVVPLGAGTATWVDLVGELNQRLVRSADLAVVVVAGRALPLGASVEPLTPTRADPSLSVVPGELPTAVGARPAPDRERRVHPRLVGASPAARLRPAEAQPSAPAIASAPTAQRQNDRSLLGGVPADLAALRQHGDRLVRPGDADHAVNVVAQGPPSWLTDALAGVLLEGLTRYPDASKAEQALARLYGRAPAEVVAANGAAQALWLLPAALRPELAACVHPLFTEAEAALHTHGVPVVRVHRDPGADFSIDPAAIPDAADLVIIGNPAAASGTIASREAVLALTRPGRTVVVDEAFMDLVPGEPGSLTALTHEGVVVVRSFTKSLSIPGVRCGAALASPAVAEQLRNVRPPWSVNAFAIAAMVALAEHPDELSLRAERAAAERADLVEQLAAIPGVQTWPSSTNHVLVRVADGASVTNALRASQIAVRPCGSFPGLTDDHLRITARDPAANQAFAAALAAALRSAEPEPQRVTAEPEHLAGERLAVVGIGEDGWAGLGEAARQALRDAPTILGSARQLGLLPAEVTGQRESWPRPMAPRLDALVASLAQGESPAQWAILASGDPMLHGIGSSLAARGVAPAALQVYPAPSAYALACARLGWPQQETSLISRVADPERPVAGAVRSGRRIVVYVAGPQGAAELAAHLRDEDLADARLVVMERLGGPGERVIESTVGEWTDDADPLHLVALEFATQTDRSFRDGRLASRVPGLPDALFGGDGQLTRAEVRAVALAALAPSADEVLWDVGAGSGTIAIEWCRAAPGTRAEAIEQRADRAATIAANAAALDARAVRVTIGEAPAALAGLPAPDAVFIGGGLTAGVLEESWAALRPGGRLVANVVTLEGERLLVDAAAAHGGRLIRLDLAHAEPIGRFSGWKPQRPIVQWSATKPTAAATTP